MDKQQELNDIKDDIARQMHKIIDKANYVVDNVREGEGEDGELEDIFVILSRMNLLLESSSNSLSEWMLLEKKSIIDEMKDQEEGGNVGFQTGSLG